LGLGRTPLTNRIDCARLGRRTLLLAAQFLHEELPVRLARRARELRKLPFGLGDTTSIKGVRKLYERSFFRIRRFPKPQSPELEERFTEMLQDIKNEHSSVQANIARGLQELSEERTDVQRQRGGILLAQGMPFDFGQFLDRFYLSRVGVRVLMGQHIMLHHPQEGFVGVIQKKCQPSVVCQHAIEDAQRICEMQYGYCPEIIVEGSTELTLPYIPEHLHYIFFELLKNSCRAVTERFIDTPADMPPIHVVFAEVVALQQPCTALCPPALLSPLACAPAISFLWRELRAGAALARRRGAAGHHSGRHLADAFRVARRAGAVLRRWVASAGRGGRGHQDFRQGRRHPAIGHGPPVDLHLHHRRQAAARPLLLFLPTSRAFRLCSSRLGGGLNRPPRYDSDCRRTRLLKKSPGEPGEPGEPK